MILQIAIFVYQAVARPNVAVDQTSAVNVFQSTQYLVEEKLNVPLGEVRVRPHDRPKVGFHNVRDDVDIAVRLLSCRDEHGVDIDDILVGEEAHDPHLPQGPARERHVIEDAFHLPALLRRQHPAESRSDRIIPNKSCPLRAH